MLEVKNITKLYNKNAGIQDLSIQVESGDVVCLVGPNGAGKTTAIKCIAGLLESQEGKVILNGSEINLQKTKKNIGYMQDSLDFYDNMTIYEVLDMIDKIKLGGKFHREIDVYLKKYDLYNVRNTTVRLLSMGMRRKLTIIMALLGEMELIILDEPTNGVDTLGIIFLKEDIKKMSEKGKMILLSSHVLDFVSMVCNRAIFLKEGKVIEDLSDRDEKFIHLEEVYRNIYC